MAKQIENEKLCAILSYILIGVIWYFVDEKMKKSELARYHAKQGLALLIAAIIYSIIVSVLVSILFIPMVFTGTGLGLILIVRVLNLIPLIWVVIGIINAANGNMKPLPLIGRFGEKFSF